jgi:hypothetical protein
MDEFLGKTDNWITKRNLGQKRIMFGGKERLRTSLNRTKMEHGW